MLRRNASISSEFSHGSGYGSTLGDDVWVVADDLDDAKAIGPLHDHVHHAVGRLKVARNRGDRANIKNITDARIFFLGRFARYQADG